MSICLLLCIYLFACFACCRSCAKERSTTPTPRKTPTVVPTSGNPAPKKKANPGSGGDALGDDAQVVERKLRLHFAGTLAKCLSDANLRHDRETAKRVVESANLAARAAEAHCKEVRELHEARDQLVAHSNAEERSLLNKNILLKIHLTDAESHKAPFDVIRSCLPQFLAEAEEQELDERILEGVESRLASIENRTLLGDFFRAEYPGSEYKP
jgi:hypothetical protein